MQGAKIHSQRRLINSSIASALLLSSVASLAVSHHQPAYAQATSSCFDQEVTSLDFGTSTLITGPDLGVGARYLYTDITGDGTTNGIIEIINFANGASLNAIDTNVLNPGNFQPELNAALNVDSGVDFRIEFVNATTGAPIFLDIAINSIDVDGNGNPAGGGAAGDLREYVEYETTLNSTVLNDPTNLSQNASPPSAGDRVRFESTTTQFAPGINPAVLTNVVAGLYNNVSNFEFRVGALQAGNPSATAPAANTRITSLGFSCPAFDETVVEPTPDANPSITVTKTATAIDGVPFANPADANLAVGTEITYTYDVLNNGDVTLDNINLVDAHNGNGPAPTPGAETLQNDVAPVTDSTDSGADGIWDTLGPGDTVRFTATYIITQEDVDTLQ